MTLTRQERNTVAGAGEREAAPSRPGLRLRVAALLGLCVLLALLTRGPFLPAHLFSFDSVNLALALEDFDPSRNQPQPPGYPLFVLESRLLNLLFDNPQRTFGAIAILVSGLAVGLVYLLGRRMYSVQAGAVAAALLFAAPPFWFSGLTSPLRPHLALFSALVAYLCWRTSQGEQRMFAAASLALGVGGGFRPELTIFLFPLWLWTGLRCRRPLLVKGAALLAGAAALWIALLLYASGGTARMMNAFSHYALAQTQDTSVLIDASQSWRRTASRAVIWTGLAVLPWLCAVPLARLRELARGDGARKLFFLALWFLPGFAFHFAVHVGDPDHVLTTIPAMCVAGAVVLAAAGERIAGWFADHATARALPIWAALVISMLLFFGQFPLPQRGAAVQFRGLASLSDAALIGIYESSYARVLWVEQMTRLGLEEIGSLKRATNRPVRLVWMRDGEPVWRKVAYYLPGERIYVLDQAGDPGVMLSTATEWSSNKVVAQYRTSPYRLPVPRGARLIWIVGANVADQLAKEVPLRRSGNLYYTDLPETATSLHAGPFDFVAVD